MTTFEPVENTYDFPTLRAEESHYTAGGLFISASASYGGTHLDAETARALAAEIARLVGPEPEPEPILAYKKGDKVLVTGGGYSHDIRIGSVATVERDAYPDSDVVIQGEHTQGRTWTQNVPAHAVEPYTAPEFKVGDRVVRTGPHNLVGDDPDSDRYGESECKVGWVGTVTRLGGITGNFGVSWDLGRSSSITPSSLAHYTPAPVNAIGAQVYVTGDEYGWGHGIKAGTLVTILEDDYAFDGSYLVDPGTRTGDYADEDYHYVDAGDLDVVAPAPTYKVGDWVRVTGAAHSPRHHIIPGTVARVESISGGTGSLTLTGPTSNGAHSQFVNPADVEPAEAPEPTVAGYKVGDEVRVVQDGRYDGSLAWQGDPTIGLRLYGTAKVPSTATVKDLDTRYSREGDPVFRLSNDDGSFYAKPCQIEPLR